MPANHPPVMPTANQQSTADGAQHPKQQRGSVPGGVAAAEIGGPFITYTNGNIWTANTEVCWSVLHTTNWGLRHCAAVGSCFHFPSISQLLQCQSLGLEWAQSMITCYWCHSLFLGAFCYSCWFLHPVASKLSSCDHTKQPTPGHIIYHINASPFCRALSCHNKKTVALYRYSNCLFLPFAAVPAVALGHQHNSRCHYRQNRHNWH